MTPLDREIDLAALPTEERYELAMVLLDSVFSEREASSQLLLQLAEVRRRVAEMDREYIPGELWRAVVTRIIGRS